ncbi:MAG TPA: RHS repeat-associated core domain-containing protein, partial [Nevskiales bacterium]|nr:RHS repeat-associated core domain-containing protein [Nevskiales bacterium]
TPQALSGAQRQIVWQGDYEPFGNVTVKNDAATQPLRFPGQYADGESGLHDNWFRSYDPDIGRYLQSDPIGLWGGMSTYAYTFSNPVRYTDPAGLETCLFTVNGFPGHVALYGSRGVSGGWLYDPSGSYARANGGGEGDLVPADSSTFDRFAQLHKLNDDDSTSRTCKDTTESQELALERAAEARGGGFGPSCASDVSAVLRASGIFPSVPQTIWPGRLSGAFANSLPAAQSPTGQP